MMQSSSPASLPARFNVLSRLRRNSFVVLCVTSLFFFYEFAMTNIFDVLEAPIRQHYHLSGTAIGFLASLYFYTDMAMIFPAGMLLDRYSPRKLITLAMVTCSIGVLMVAMVSNVYLLGFARLLMGLGGGFCFVGCIRVAANWFKPKRMGRVSGFIVTMGMLGGVMVHAPLAYLMSLVGWRMALIVVAIIGFAISAAIWLVVRDAPEGKQFEIQFRTRELQQTGVLKSLFLALKSRQNWFCGLYTSLLNIPIFMLGALWGVPFLVRVYGFDAVTAALISGMLFFGSMFGALAAGFVSDLMGRRRRPMIWGGVLSILTVFVIMFVRVDSELFLIVMFFLLGFITSTQIISYATVAESNSPMITSTAVGIVSLMAVGGGAVIQPLVGWLLGLGGTTTVHGVTYYAVNSYLNALWLIPFCFVIGIILAAFLKETYCRRPEGL